MAIVVQKYGGTSVRSPESRELIVNKVKQLVEQKKQVVLVVSAMGRKGEPYATDSLIQLLNLNESPVSRRELDLIMSCGEVISTAVMTQTLLSHGIMAKSLTGYQAGMITDDCHGDARILMVNPQRIHECLDEGNVVVIAGFQGMSDQGDITTLGRGGSDTSAVAIGEALEADCVEIYTDVDGVMTADPRLVSDSKVLSSVTYDEVYHMAVYGAKVVDHKAVSIARRSKCPLVIKNTFTDHQGTIIADQAYLNKMNLSNPKRITAVTSHGLVRRVTMNISGHNHERLFDEMARRDIQMDMLNFSDHSQSFTISQGQVDDLQAICLELGFNYEMSDEQEKITVVGFKIHHKPGIIKETIMALTDADLEILQSSNSNTSISFLINKGDSPKAVQVLHERFQLNHL